METPSDSRLNELEFYKWIKYRELYSGCKFPPSNVIFKGSNSVSKHRFRRMCWGEIYHLCVERSNYKYFMFTSTGNNRKWIIPVNHFRKFHLPFLAPTSRLHLMYNITDQFVWILLLRPDLYFERDIPLAGSHLVLNHKFNRHTSCYPRNT